MSAWQRVDSCLPLAGGINSIPAMETSRLFYRYPHAWLGDSKVRSKEVRTPFEFVTHSNPNAPLLVSPIMELKLYPFLIRRLSSQLMFHIRVFFAWVGGFIFCIIIGGFSSYIFASSSFPLATLILRTACTSAPCLKVILWKFCLILFIFIFIHFFIIFIFFLFFVICSSLFTHIYIFICFILFIFLIFICLFLSSFLFLGKKP